MKTHILLILIMSSIFSCLQDDNYLITKTRIGKYKLNDILTETYNKESFDIKVNSENRITLIITSSNKFKTKGNFGVGSNFEDIKIVKDYEGEGEGEITISKSNTLIGSLGKTIFYNNILFIDNNNDNIVDLVWISNE